MKERKRKPSQADSTAWAMDLECVGILHMAGIAPCRHRGVSRLKGVQKQRWQSTAPGCQPRGAPAEDAEQPLGILGGRERGTGSVTKAEVMEGTGKKGRCVN